MPDDFSSAEKKYIDSIINAKEQTWMPDWAGALQNSQLGYLYELLSKTKGKTIIDLGCFIGGFTKVMAQYAKEKGGKVYSIDLFKESTAALCEIHQGYDVRGLLEQNLTERGLIDYVQINHGNSWEFADKFDNCSVDFVFIDADHRYDSVRKDILSWFPKVRIGGIIAGHDYESNQYDENYINEDGHGDRHHGVIKAVTDIFGNVEHQYTIWHKEIK